MGCVKFLTGGVIAILAIIGGTFIVLYATKDGGSTEDYTPAEVSAAARVLSNMDLKQDPCQDFYKYSCGGWLDNTILPSTSGRYSTFDAADENLEIVLKTELENMIETSDAESIKKAKNFYKACMDISTINQNGYDQAEVLMKSLGGWPIGDGSKVADEWSVPEWAELYISWAREANSQTLFSAFVGVDQTNVENHIAGVDQPGLFLGTEQFYVSINDNENNNNLKEAYITYLTDLASIYCKFEHEHAGNPEKCDLASIRMQANLVYGLENELASIVKPGMARAADDSLTLNLKSLGDFKNDHGAVIGELVEIVMKDYFSSQTTVDDRFIFNDASEDFFDKLNVWLPGLNTTTVVNFLGFRTLAGMTNSLGEEWIDVYDKYNAVRRGVKGHADRYRTCISMTNNALTMPVGALYVEKAFSKEAKDQTDEMIENVITIFEDVILEEQTDWMDDATKEEAHQKAKMVEPFIGYPEYIIDDQDKMDADYADYTVASDKCFNNVLEGNKRKFAEDLNSLNKPTQRDRWSTGPAIVNAWYSPTRNTITFPAGILQAPFFDVGQSVAMNYGGIGMVIGHELTHGFDDQGSHYDGIGNKRDWWLPETKKNFEGKAQCLADQYSGYYWPQAGLNLAGDSENGENIADNGGIRETYYAYQKWAETNTDKKLPGLDFLSPEQQLFVGYAQVWCAKYTDAEAQSRVLTDVHAPGPFRVLGPLSNFDKFWEAFSCKKGDGYYPPNANQDKVCEVWGTNDA